MFLTSKCIEKIYSVSVVVGGPLCNAACKHCGGMALRGRLHDRERMLRSLVAASRLSLGYGGWTLSLTGAGEPLMYPNDVTRVLERLRHERIAWPFINLFTNGSLLRNHKDALRMWGELGLTSVVLSLHSTDNVENDKVYGIRAGIPLEEKVHIIRAAGLSPRVILLLGKGSISTLHQYIEALNYLRTLGVQMVTAWPLSDNAGKRTELTISRRELFKIHAWLLTKTTPVMGHVWGGKVRAYGDMNIRLTNYVSQHKATNNYIRQLVVFQDGELSYSWYQPGMICLY